MKQSVRPLISKHGVALFQFLIWYLPVPVNIIQYLFLYQLVFITKLQTRPKTTNDGNNFKIKTVLNPLVFSYQVLNRPKIRTLLSQISFLQSVFSKPVRFQNNSVRTCYMVHPYLIK